ncbi:hypothetical protein TGAMA5MH_03796 [Trichoderma gamsii]|uniref:FAD-binding domain-containing protein n=1 Tax=Trichoderma gamsii TaxID=398673 RepID=A0A2K0TFZ7_9HYPO|nr:hypothetical protein TGAMA5MH_03796 [Trichoderma gamsii]
MELTDLTIENDIVTTVFNNGASVWKGRYLVGADGPRSEVRSFLVPPGTSELHPSPITVFNFGASFNEKEAHYLRNKIHSVATLAPHPEQKTYFFLTHVPNPEAPETWLFQVSLSFWNEGEQPQTFEDRMRIFKKLGANYCEPYRSVVSWVNEDIKIPLDHFATWKNIQPWKNYGGKVTIAGDAAHPMVPYRAQGLNNALEDAGHYVRAITSVVNGKGNLSSIMEAYDADAYNRGKNDMTTSDEQMYACHHWDALMKTPLITDGFTKRQ